jgi:hypothetical protein
MEPRWSVAFWNREPDGSPLAFFLCPSSPCLCDSVVSPDSWFV